MTEAERYRLTLAYCRDHEAEWAACLAKPLAEREANQDKVDAALQRHGVQAGREMMVALGMPVPPVELWEPVELLEAKRAAKAVDDAELVRAMADMLDVPEEEAAYILAERPNGRVDH